MRLAYRHAFDRLSLLRATAMFWRCAQLEITPLFGSVSMWLLQTPVVALVHPRLNYGSMVLFGVSVFDDTKFWSFRATF